MKKFLLLFFTVFSVTAYSQGKGDVEFGLHIGGNFSNITQADYTYSYAIGFNAGVSMEYYFSNSWGIKTKLMYDQMGWNDDVIYDPVTDRYVDTNFRLNYLTIPVMGKYHFGNKKEFYFNAGPYLGILLEAHDTRYDTDVKEFFNTTDFGLMLGVGYTALLSEKVKFFAGFDARGGVIDIIKYNENPVVLNSCMNFNVGINMLLK
ncbi:hypothetical protein FSS13T_07900 [Flavobacterium saliperosum S13]|uniref:Outer membrane protein beta-barrel domain-containing protein n=2 Tax=Flavobacterium saliperosum TaxID=329186 RepID=A0A1G4W107_9FLAO|nr:porin family protein [Flavobacterium saliperosum]ESU27526.1 hypothetical protein FSS13T_07900 [Flavobacterium saliperosum S13]SCX15060.1 Outer membrane protein beta-barrel domain-containing protein [Flavobacterium saliperosum]